MGHQNQQFDMAEMITVDTLNYLTGAIQYEFY